MGWVEGGDSRPGDRWEIPRRNAEAPKVVTEAGDTMVKHHWQPVLD